MSRARDLANLANEGVWTIDTANLRVGINSATPDTKLDVVGIVSATNVAAASSVTATTLYGDGSALTGIAATDNVRTDTLVVSGVTTAAGVLKATDTTESTSTTTGALLVSGGVGIAKSLHVGGNVSIAGTLTYQDVTNIDSVGLVTARTGVRVTAGGVIVTAGVSTFANEVKVTAGGIEVDAGGLDIAGVSTFAGARDIGNVDVNLDGSAAGVSSVTWDASADSLIFKDNVTAKFGDGSDLNLYHDGTNSFIVNKTGYLSIGAKHGEIGAIINPDSSVDLYYDNAKKIETTGSGVIVTGVCTATSLVGRHGKVETVTKSTGYTLADGDQGKMVITDSDVTVPQNIFSAGDVFTVCNSSGSSIDIVKGTGINLYTVGTATNATAALAQKGIAVITCFAGNDFIVGGGGLG